jgi:hypothetical protein
VPLGKVVEGLSHHLELDGAHDLGVCSWLDIGRVFLHDVGQHDTHASSQDVGTDVACDHLQPRVEAALAVETG